MLNVSSGTLLGHIMRREGITMDLEKVNAILSTLAPTTAMFRSQFLGQIQWHSWMLQYLADFATPLHMAVHKMPFWWMEIEEEAYQALKIMLSHAQVVQNPDWSQPFHVFVNASDVAIGSVLMQMTPPKWYRLVYYVSRRLSVAEKNYSMMEQEALGMIYC